MKLRSFLGMSCLFRAVVLANPEETDIWGSRVSTAVWYSMSSSKCPDSSKMCLRFLRVFRRMLVLYKF